MSVTTATQKKPHECHIFQTSNNLRIPIYLPLQSGVFDKQLSEAVIEKFAVGDSYDLLQSIDLTIDTHRIIWSSLLSFLLFRKNASNLTGGQNSSTRIVFLFSSTFQLKASYRLLKLSLSELQIPQSELLKVAIISAPSDFCINQHIVRRYPHKQSNIDASCRAKVQCGSCRHYSAVKSSSLPPEVTQNLPDIEDAFNKLSSSKVCPYYSFNSTASAADLILTTNEAVRETLRGERLSKECIPLDENTILFSTDLFGLERVLETCFDFSVSANVLQKIINFVNRYNGIITVYYREEAGSFNVAEFKQNLRKFLRILEKFRSILSGTTVVKADTYRDRLKVLLSTGVPSIDPLFCQNILTATFIAFDELSSRTPQPNFDLTFDDLSQVIQLFGNLINADVANIVFGANSSANRQKEEQNPFRFWQDKEINLFKPEEERNDPACKVWNFFCVSCEPAVNALKSRGVKCVVGVGPMVPLALAKMSSLMTTTVMETPLAYKPTAFIALFRAGPVPFPINLRFDFRTREEASYKRSLGLALSRLVESIPDNCLIVFPSRKYYDSCVATWGADGTEKKLGFHVAQDGPCLHHNAPSCGSCIELLANRRRDGQSVVTFARAPELDGVIGGFQAVIVVGLPYKHVEDQKVVAKSAYLEMLGFDARKNFYSQEAVFSAAEPFFKSSSSDPLTKYRGRILIFLDTRLQSQVSFLPLWIQRSLRSFDTFTDGILALQNHISSIRRYELSNGHLDPDVIFHIRKFPFVFDPSEPSSEKFCAAVEKEVLTYNVEKSVHLLVARLVKVLKIAENFERTGFLSEVVPWLMNFKHYLRNSGHQAQWSASVASVMKQILEGVKEETSSAEISVILPQNVEEDANNRCPIM